MSPEIRFVCYRYGMSWCWSVQFHHHPLLKRIGARTHWIRNAHSPVKWLKSVRSDSDWTTVWSKTPLLDSGRSSFPALYVCMCEWVMGVCSLRRRGALLNSASEDVCKLVCIDWLAKKKQNGSSYERQPDMWATIWGKNQKWQLCFAHLSEIIAVLLNFAQLHFCPL